MDNFSVLIYIACFQVLQQLLEFCQNCTVVSDKVS